MRRNATRIAHLPPTPAEVGRAAFLGFCTRLNDDAIAAKLGIVRRTLVRWKQRPEYAAARVALDLYCRQSLARDYGYPDPTLGEADDDVW